MIIKVYAVLFQFHKVRLKELKKIANCVITQFQFHKVRLKVLKYLLITYRK